MVLLVLLLYASRLLDVLVDLGDQCQRLALVARVLIALQLQHSFQALSDTARDHNTIE